MIGLDSTGQSRCKSCVGANATGEQDVIEADPLPANAMDETRVSNRAQDLGA